MSGRGDVALSESLLVTCGLPYANGRAHIGHLRTYIPADAYVRMLKKEGKEPLFVCGSDTHGTPIVINAEQEGVSPEELVNRYHAHFIEVFETMGVCFDYFGSTHSPTNHHRTHEIVRANIENGYIYPKNIKLAYCPKCERFLPDRYVEGICPSCGAVARGDECDQGCGIHLEPGEILEPVCKVCGTPAEYREQEHYFFRLSAFERFLLEYLEGLDGTPYAINYAKEWVRRGLKDWCITRNLEWGVSFPGRDDLVVYVWVDAPIGYISFTEEWCEQHGRDWKDFWIRNGRIVHFIGGDIVYHHCIFWPALLSGANYNLPSAVVASGMVKIEDKTFSKSRGYVVWVSEDYLKAGFHPDLLRYYLLSYTSHTKELNFSWELFAEKVNGELLASLGNFIHRVLTFTHRHFGNVPSGEVDEEIFERISAIIDDMVEANARYEFKQMCDAAMSLADFANTYFQKSEPWQLIKTDREACAHVLVNCLQLCKALAVLFEPVMPHKMEQVWTMLGLSGSVHDAKLEDALVKIPAGTHIKAPKVLFEKIEDEKVEMLERAMRERIKAAMGDKEEQEEKISYEEFSKLDLRIGKVIRAERVKGASKLLRLEVDVGDSVRQIVAGIANSYTPEELEGKEVVVVVNLKPAKIFGIESQGMVLAADVDGTAVLLSPMEEVKAGVRVR